MAVSTAHIAHCGPSRGGGGGSNGNDPGIATPCENAFTALQLMGGENINQLPVVSNGHLEGVVTRSYFVHLLRPEMDNVFIHAGPPVAFSRASNRPRMRKATFICSS
jgi:hypothetical protein